MTFKNIENNINQYNNKPEGKPMTITIGVLCEGGQTVLMLSDKMGVTQSGLVFEATKSFFLTDNSLVLISGNPSNAIFLEDAQKNTQPNAPIKALADLISGHYSAFRMGRFTTEILNPNGFVNFNDFHAKQKQLDGVLIGSIMEQSRIYNIGVELILGGHDNHGGHIFHVQYNGVPVIYDQAGFCCAPVFMNGARAAVVFEALGYSPELSSEKTLAIAFSAKKRSEGLGGIGEKTDAWIIDNKGIKSISENTIKTLEEKYKIIKTNFSWVKELETPIETHEQCAKSDNAEEMPSPNNNTDIKPEKA